MSNEYFSAALADFRDGYIEAALFSETCEDSGRPLQERYMPSDLTAGSLAAIEADCRKFMTDNAGELLSGQMGGLSMVEAGRLFWFSRCGHGTGFFDCRILCDALQDRLQNAARRVGEAYLIEGIDDPTGCLGYWNS